MVLIKRDLHVPDDALCQILVKTAPDPIKECGNSAVIVVEIGGLNLFVCSSCLTIICAQPRRTHA